MYQNKVAVAIKVNGQILRERGDSVSLPFGSEYAVLVKNLHGVRVQFKLQVDGEDATGTWIVLQPNTSVDMEWFIRNGNWQSGPRFKFVERTGQIEAHRGIKVDDGLVRVEFQVEQPTVTDTIYRRRVVTDEWPSVPPPFVPYPYPPRPWRRYPDVTWDGTRRRLRSSSVCAAGKTSSNVLRGASATMSNAPAPDVADVGITVPGSISHQSFVSAESFRTTGVTDAIVLHLRGLVGGKRVSAPVTVKTKRQCPTCGKSARGEFCDRCGTNVNA